MVCRSLFLIIVCGCFCSGNSGCDTNDSMTGTPGSGTPVFLPESAYLTVTVRPAMLLKQPAMRQLYDNLVKTADAAFARDFYRFGNFGNRGRIVFPGGQHSELVNLESYTMHLCTRTTPKGSIMYPSQGLVYRYKTAEQFNRALGYAKADFKTNAVPAFAREVWQYGTASPLSDEKPNHLVGVKEDHEEFESPPIKGQPLPPRRPAPPRWKPEVDEDSKPIPESEQWKYISTIWTENDRTLLFSRHGLTVQQMLDTKNSPSWAKEYAKVAGFPLSAAVDLRQVRENAKHLISFRYLSVLPQEIQKAIKIVIEQNDFALVAIDMDDGFKLTARLESKDEALAKQTVALLEQWRSRMAGLALPLIAEVNGMLPGGGGILGTELQAALADLKITSNGKVVSLGIDIPAEAWDAALKKTLAGLQKTEEDLKGIRSLAAAMREYLFAYKAFPATSLAKSGQPVSWRVKLLPYLGEKALYAQYNQEEPWDSVTNQKVLAQMPAVYRAPGADPNSTMTSYSMPVTKGGMHPEAVMKRGFSEQSFQDGTLHTIAILETETQIPWTKPDDLAIDKTQPLPALGFKDQPMLRVIMASGDIRVIRKDVTSEELHPWLTMRGGELPTTAIDMK